MKRLQSLSFERTDETVRKKKKRKGSWLYLEMLLFPSHTIYYKYDECVYEKQCFVAMVDKGEHYGGNCFHINHLIKSWLYFSRILTCRLVSLFFKLVYSLLVSIPISDEVSGCCWIFVNNLKETLRTKTNHPKQF